MKKVFITGGAGFIGQAVARTLSEKGLEVVTFDLREPPKKYGEHVIGTIMFVDELHKAMKGCDAVVHLAAMLGVQRTEVNRIGCLDVNILGTKNVLEACAKAGIKRFVFASSSEVYGEPIKNPISEMDPVLPKSVYGVTKLAGEEYTRGYGQEYGIDYTIIRFFNAYGPGQGPDWVMPRFIQSVVAGEQPLVYGDGKQERCFCHVDDSALGVYLALTGDKAIGETFNIGNDATPTNMEELARTVIAVSGKQIEPKWVPMEQSDRTQQREIIKRIADVSKARSVLGFEPRISLEAGIRDVMEKDYGVSGLRQ